MADTATQLPALDRGALTPVIRRLLHRDTIEVGDWHVDAISTNRVAPSVRRVYRVAGTGADQGAQVAWTLALNAIRGSRDANAPDTDPAHWAYWRREPLAYQSGLLDRAQEARELVRWLE